MVTLRAVDFADEMIEVRKWLDQQMPEPAGFTYTYKEIGEDIHLSVDFQKNQYADAFEGRFGGQRSKTDFPNLYKPLTLPDRVGSATMAQACWWRLLAEEIRTEADGFGSESARETMEIAARGWERLAEELEQRLARNDHLGT